MKIYNPLLEEKQRRYSTLDADVIKQLDDFNELSIEDYQLKVIKRKRQEIKDGDVFILSPKEGIYFYGKVIKSNIKHKYETSFLHQQNLVFIFKCKTTEQNMDKFVADYNNLLIRPAIVNKNYWSRGYFFNVGNEPVKEEEKNLDYGLVYMQLGSTTYHKEDGEQIEKPKILGIYGITTISGIADEIGRELIIDPSLLDS